MKNSLILILFFIATIIGYSQEEQITYYLELTNKNYIPKAKVKKDGSKSFLTAIKRKKTRKKVM